MNKLKNGAQLVGGFIVITAGMLLVVIYIIILLFLLAVKFLCWPLFKLLPETFVVFKKIANLGW